MLNSETFKDCLAMLTLGFPGYEYTPANEAAWYQDVQWFSDKRFAELTVMIRQNEQSLQWQNLAAIYKRYDSLTAERGKTYEGQKSLPPMRHATPDHALFHWFIMRVMHGFDSMPFAIGDDATAKTLSKKRREFMENHAEVIKSCEEAVKSIPFKNAMQRQITVIQTAELHGVEVPPGYKHWVQEALLGMET